MSDLTDFLLARIAEDEAWEAEHQHFGDGTAPEYVPPWWTRVRAECEAKRRIVRWAQQWPLRRGRAGDGIDAEDALLHILAAVYSDHPDYQESWRI